MKELAVSILIVTLVVVGALWLAKVVNDQSRQDFAAACAEVNGTPVYNGRNWECLK